MKRGQLLGLILVVCLIAKPSFAQQPPPQTPPSSTGSQPQIQPPSQDQRTSTEVKTFAGRIVKSGDKFVLSDPAGQTTYQLDDQQKAQAFVNKNVRVTGMLDASTGTIRVTAIDPA